MMILSHENVAMMQIVALIRINKVFVIVIANSRLIVKDQACSQHLSFMLKKKN